MIKHYAVLTLEHLLQGVMEERQEIFVNFKKMEEISYEQEQTTTKEERDEHKDSQSISDSDNDGGDSEVSSSDSKVNESIVSEENKVVGKTKTTHVTKVYNLTRWGKRFINTMMDQAQTKHLNELCLTDNEDYSRYLNPNINFYRLLDVKGKVYFNNDAKMYRPESANIMEFSNHDIDNMDWFTDENGDILPMLSSSEYNRTWELIMKESSVEGMQSSIVNKKLTKEDKFINDVKVGFSNGRLYQLFGTTPTYDEKVLAKLIGAEWKLDETMFLLPVQEEPELTDFALKSWLCTPLGKSNNNSNSSSNKGGRFQSLNKKNKAKRQQSNNDAKTTTNNSNHQSNDDAASN